MKSIEKSFSVSKLKNGTYPLPESSVNINSS
jgi:hypothetical protein